MAADLPDTDPGGDDVHRMKGVAVGPDHTVYVDIGSSSNVDTTDLSREHPRAVVMAYRPGGKGRVFATGIRNGDGLSFDPDGELWTAVNNRDQIAYPFHRAYGGEADAFGQVIPAYVDDHPPDELAKLTRGRNVGWPYCNPDPDTDQPGGNVALHYGNLPFDPDAQTNPGGAGSIVARSRRSSEAFLPIAHRSAFTSSREARSLPCSGMERSSVRTAPGIANPHDPRPCSGSPGKRSNERSADRSR